MPDLHSHSAMYTLCGLLVGLLVGFTGVGGGSLMTPMLVLLFGFNPATAVGTDLLHAAISKACGTVVHGRNATVDWRIVARLAAGSIPATVVPLTLVAGLGHWYLGSVDWTLLVSLLMGSLPGIVIGSQLTGYVPERILRPILGTALVAVGARLLV